MDKEAFYRFADEHKIKYLEHEDLSKHTSFKIGGPAEIFVKPGNAEQISLIIDFCRENKIPLLPLGKGSNVLVSDKGIDGVVMYFGSDFGKIELIDKLVQFFNIRLNLEKKIALILITKSIFIFRGNQDALNILGHMRY